MDTSNEEPKDGVFTMEDVVNHPNHYNQYNGFEVIDVCEQLRGPDGNGNFNRGNAFKYLARAGWKNPEKHIEDLEKAKFYIQREIDRVESQNWMAEGPKPEIVHRCPECSAPANPYREYDPNRFSCPNGHGEVFLNEKTARPHRCPVCDHDLRVDNTCPNKHGWIYFRLGSAEGVWVESAETKIMGCPQCDFQLTRSLSDDDVYFCEKGHGTMKISSKIEAKTTR